MYRAITVGRYDDKSHCLRRMLHQNQSLRMGRSEWNRSILIFPPAFLLTALHFNHIILLKLYSSCSAIHYTFQLADALHFNIDSLQSLYYDCVMCDEKNAVAIIILISSWRVGGTSKLSSNKQAALGLFFHSISIFMLLNMCVGVTRIKIIFNSKKNLKRKCKWIFIFIFLSLAIEASLHPCVHYNTVKRICPKCRFSLFIVGSVFKLESSSLPTVLLSHIPIHDRQWRFYSHFI